MGTARFFFFLTVDRGIEKEGKVNFRDFKPWLGVRGPSTESQKSPTFELSFSCSGYRIYIAPCSWGQSIGRAASQRTGGAAQESKTWYQTNIKCIIHCLDGCDRLFPS